MSKRFVGVAIAISMAMLLSLPVYAAKREVPAPFPLAPVVVNPKVASTYPSVAGDFMVYSQRQGGRYAVVRTALAAPVVVNRAIRPLSAGEAIRFGVALTDGGIGYVSNRMGPVSAWLKMPRGDGHVAIANVGTHGGGVVPEHLSVDHAGRIWCFDTALENRRRSRLLSEFGNASLDPELIGQDWRMYSAEAVRASKLAYRAIKAGNANKFPPPVLFVFDRASSELVMIPNAFDGAVSPDGKRIAFVRENDGNFDIWLQRIDGRGLTQVTSSPFGDFEPAWSPDGKRIAFVSNRDRQGDVRHTSVYVIDLNSSVVTRATVAGDATDGGPAWQDGMTILFHSNRNPKKPQGGRIPGWNIWKVHMQEVQ
jgi:TolB protein